LEGAPSSRLAASGNREAYFLVWPTRAVVPDLYPAVRRPGAPRLPRACSETLQPGDLSHLCASPSLCIGLFDGSGRRRVSAHKPHGMPCADARTRPSAARKGSDDDAPSVTSAPIGLAVDPRPDLMPILQVRRGAPPGCLITWIGVLQRPQAAGSLPIVEGCYSSGCARCCQTNARRKQAPVRPIWRASRALPADLLAQTVPPINIGRPS
jgi:hypothetical protein